jgi:hypothetical protein
MTTIPKITFVPRAILRQLVKRFETSHIHGYTFDDHANWMREKGYPISRSIIHRFCQELRRLKASNPDSKDVLALYLDEIERSKICL